MTYKIQAVEKAIEGGYDWYGGLYSTVLLDPLFWQCLGKSMGWNRDQSGLTEITKTDWIPYWHRLIDHLASGGDAEGYFKKLLS